MAHSQACPAKARIPTKRSTQPMAGGTTNAKAQLCGEATQLSRYIVFKLGANAARIQVCPHRGCLPFPQLVQPL